MRNLKAKLKSAWGRVTGPDPGRRIAQEGQVLFDDMARLAASGMPRRSLLRLGISGMAGTTLASLGVRVAWADICNCNGTSYDSDTQCCTSSGVQNKYPITNLDACPNRVPHPGYTPSFNGCGPEGSVVTNFVPNTFGLANFTTCCDNHDICYGTCLSAKDGCDSTFYSCLAAECNTWYQVINHGVIYDQLYQNCLTAATVYYSAVHFRGGGAYTSAQDGACDCCGPVDPQQPCCPTASVCGSQCCAQGQTCINGSCCPNQQVCGTQCCPPGQSCINGTCQGTCSYQCPCPGGPNGGKIYATCSECLAACPTGLACFGYLYCVPLGNNCGTCP